MSKPTSIRNFCIIAHIDHGKSTLADRLMEITGTLQKRELQSQTLDQMDLERERGITIKLTPVRMEWKWVELNLIDTPGHVDFQYEVSRSLASVEGAILVVDATQGIEAQTLSNVYLAMENDLTIIPVLNKIDLPSADVDRVSEEVMNLLGCKKEDIIAVSAKTWINVEAILEEVEAVPQEQMIYDSKWSPLYSGNVDWKVFFKVRAPLLQDKTRSAKGWRIDNEGFRPHGRANCAQQGISALCTEGQFVSIRTYPGKAVILRPSPD